MIFLTNFLIILISLIIYTNQLLFPQDLSKKFIHAVWYNVMYLNLENEEETKKQIETHIQKFSELKINTLIFMTKDPKGYVYYKSNYAPSKCSWDVLKFVIEQCKRYNIEVHSYINVFKDEYLTTKYPQYEELRQKGQKTKWVSPAVKQVRERLLNIIKEIITKYDIAGIQLDRIRYEGYRDIGFNKESIHQYKNKYKRFPSPHDENFYQFKCDLISSFVKEAYYLAKSTNKNIKFSAAVFHTPTTSKKNLIAQQWDLWVKNGWLDMVFPMAYTDSPDIFLKYLKEDIEVVKNTNVKLIMGIGAYYDGMDSKKLSNQIKMCLEEPLVDGVCYFNGYSILEKSDFQEVIKSFSFFKK